MSLNYYACILSHTGRVRHENQDNFLFQGRYFLPLDCGDTAVISAAGNTAQPLADFVLDGMGGENEGEMASLAAAAALAEYYEDFAARLVQSPEDADLDIQALCDAASRRVRDFGRARGSGVSGTTLSMLACAGDTAFFANVGDSPIWLLREGHLYKKFREHVRAARPAKPGFTPKGGLTQFVGIDMEGFILTPSVSCEQLLPGDRVLICSDGLGDMVSSHAIEAILAEHAHAAETCITLLQAALMGGGKDNITVYICDFSEGDAPWPHQADVSFFKDQERRDKQAYYLQEPEHRVIPPLFD